jgi:muramoyltetrapeptide carboxypeptidase
VLSALIVGHDPGVAWYIADRLAVMHLGRIVEIGSVADVLLRPQHPDTRALIPVLPEGHRDRPTAILTGEPPDPTAIPAACRFHPRCPRLASPGSSDERAGLCRGQAVPVLAAGPGPGEGSPVACHLAGLQEAGLPEARLQEDGRATVALTQYPGGKEPTTLTTADAPSRPRSLARAPALRPGDKVAVLSISSPADPAELGVGLDALRFAGLEPVLYPSAHDQGTMRHYLAGDDQMRVADLRGALTDPAIAGIVFATGGSGAQRTLEAMNWDGIAALPPKILAGYSDVTAVLEAVACRLGWASLLSPMVTSHGCAAHYSFGSMLRALMHPERATDISYPQAVTITGGTARGITLGGNLTLLAASLGTSTSRPARGGILLLEDENEEDYRLDRMLTQLRRSGYLDGVCAVVAGTFEGCGEPAAIQDIIAERLADPGVPLIARANVGHGGYFQTFPVGVAAELDADARTLRLLDPPLEPAAAPAAAAASQGRSMTGSPA